MGCLPLALVWAACLVVTTDAARADKHCELALGDGDINHEGDCSSLLQLTSKVQIGKAPGWHALEEPTGVTGGLDRGCHVWQQRLIPISLSLWVVVPPLAAVALYIHRSAKLDVVHALLCLILFLGSMVSTITVVESYKLAVSLDMSTSWSGLSIGVVRLGALMSSGLAWMLWRGESWHSWVRMYLSLPLLILLSGAVLYATVVLVAAGGGQLPGGLANCVLFSRMFQGLPLGPLAMFARTLMTIITPRDEQLLRQVRATMSTVLGMGSGPFLVSWISSCDPCQGQPPDYLAGGPAGVLLVASVLILVAVYFPQVEDEIRLQTMADHGDDTVAIHEDRSVVSGAVVLMGLGMFVTSGLEVATAWLMENVSACSHTVIGLTTGAIFILAVPLGLLRERAPSLSISLFTRILAIVTTLGCLALLNVWDRVGQAMPLVTLIIGDCLVLPFVAIGVGVITAFRNKCKGPPGSLFDAGNIQFATNVSVYIGTLLGPWLARWCLELGGRSVYAACQICVVLAFNLVMQGWMVPRMAAKDAPST